MKVIKKINENNKIEIVFDNLPVFPSNTIFRGSCFSSRGIEYFADPDLITIQSGDFIFEPKKVCFCSTFKKTDSVEYILKCLDNRATGFFKALALWKERNVETAEIKTRQEIIADLDAEEKIYYRNRKGQIKKLS